MFLGGEYQLNLNHHNTLWLLRFFIAFFLLNKAKTTTDCFCVSQFDIVVFKALVNHHTFLGICIRNLFLS